MSAHYHYPPDLPAVLRDTIPALCRGKQDVIDFFRAAGVTDGVIVDLQRRVTMDRASITKAMIARTVLKEINEQGDSGLAARRQIVKCVVEFDEFYTCWPDDQLKARGLVAEVRRLVEVKDSFVRMRDEREAERHERMTTARAQLERSAERRMGNEILGDLAALFAHADVAGRGRSLEGALNRLFALDGILVRESFTLRAPDGTAVEQIDGAVELDGVLYLVEMKWWSETLGIDAVSRHLVRIYGRAGVGGILISASGFTGPAVVECERALAQRIVVLAEVREMVLLLERQGDVADWLRTKVRAALIERKPLVPV